MHFSVRRSEDGKLSVGVSSVLGQSSHLARSLHAFIVIVLTIPDSIRIGEVGLSHRNMALRVTEPKIRLQ